MSGVLAQCPDCLERRRIWWRCDLPLRMTSRWSRVKRERERRCPNGSGEHIAVTRDCCLMKLLKRYVTRATLDRRIHGLRTDLYLYISSDSDVTSSPLCDSNMIYLPVRLTIIVARTVTPRRRPLLLKRYLPHPHRPRLRSHSRRSLNLRLLPSR